MGLESTVSGFSLAAYDLWTVKAPLTPALNGFSSLNTGIIGFLPEKNNAS